MPQGTVKSFDHETEEVVVLDDDLRQHQVEPEEFAASGLLELRVGQRVRFELDESGDGPARVTNLNLVSL